MVAKKHWAETGTARRLAANYVELLDPRKLPDPESALRVGRVVRSLRSVCADLGLLVEDAAGCAALRLGAKLDTGSAILDGEREKIAHCVALLLLLRTVPGVALLSEAGWTSDLILRPLDRLDVAYQTFRVWLASVRAEVRESMATRAPQGNRVGLALVATGAHDAERIGDGKVAALVNDHGRVVPIEAGDVQGALMLARDEGASLDGLMRRSPYGLRWVETRARDLVESVSPRRERAAGTDVANLAKAVADVDAAREIRDAVDELRERGPAYAAALERWEAGGTREAVAARHGTTPKAVRVAEARIREALAQRDVG